jgi:hypothetical protein
MFLNLEEQESYSVGLSFKAIDTTYSDISRLKGETQGQIEEEGKEDNIASRDATNMEELEDEDEPEGNEVTSQEAKDDEEEGENQSQLNRHDWETIHRFSDLSFMQLLLSEFKHPDFDTVTVDDCRIAARFDGGFNHIVFMFILLQTDRVQRFVVRVPAFGTASRWQEGDAHNLHCEMVLLTYLRDYVPKIPIQEVVAFSRRCRYSHRCTILLDETIAR